jgi:hypothetical protein
MTRTAVARGPETDAVLAALRSSTLPVGDGVRPAGAGFPGQDTSATFVPYGVLFQGVPVRIDGPSSDPNADVAAEYQVTSIGVTRASATLVADALRKAFLHAELAVPQRCVQLVQWTSGRPAVRDDAVTPPLFFAIDIYTVSTSPA